MISVSYINLECVLCIFDINNAILVDNTSLLKTLWEKEKLLVTSNFSLSHSVFYLFKEHSATFIKFDEITYGDYISANSSAIANSVNKYLTALNMHPIRRFFLMNRNDFWF